MSPVKILSHTADLEIQITAKSREELFRDALVGMTQESGPIYSDEPGITRQISIQSPDQNSLLVDFLSESLRLGDTENEAYESVDFDELTEKSLRARLYGKPIKKLSLEIKAVTYHGLEIKETKTGWEARIVFDI